MSNTENQGKRVAVLPGDGIGPEVCDAAIEILRLVRPDLEFAYGDIGAAAHERVGKMLPDETVELIRACDAIFVGAVGTPEWSEAPLAQRPEQSLLWIRRELALFACLRPIGTWAGARFNGVALPQPMWIFRELTSGAYYGQPRGVEEQGGERVGYDTDRYTESEIRRFARFVFQFAERGSARVLNVDKANVMYSSSLWRDVVREVHAAEFAAIPLDHMHVDAAAFELLRRPTDWDVILAPNLFGDILSDELGVFSGSIGMLPSASLGLQEPFLYEPVHGSAPTIAGTGAGNPCGAILSAAMLCRWSLDDEGSASRIETAVVEALKSTTSKDLGGEGTCAEITSAVAAAI